MRPPVHFAGTFIEIQVGSEKPSKCSLRMLDGKTIHFYLMVPHVLFVRNQWKNHPYPGIYFNKHEQHSSTYVNHLISDLFQKKGGKVGINPFVTNTDIRNT